MTSATFIAPEVVAGTTTSWLPLTTAYPSVAGCSSAFFNYPGVPAPVCAIHLLRNKVTAADSNSSPLILDMVISQTGR